MITTDKPYNGHGNSKSAKIRKLLLSDEGKTMTVDEIAKQVKVIPQRVYSARATLRKAGLLPPARAEVTGIASLPVGGGTITISKLPEYKDKTPLTPNQLFRFRVAQGRQSTYSAHSDPLEAAASKVEEAEMERKIVKRAFMPVVVLSVFLAALLIYLYVK
jgi:hypothetical protein